MAQTRRRRRRKRRGTQAGTLDRRGPRPRSRAEARARAKRRASDKRHGGRDRGLQPPTWSGAFTRGLIGAGIFLGLMLLLFGQGFGQALVLSLAMLALYVPLGYMVDSFFYRRRLAALQREREARRQ